MGSEMCIRDSQTGTKLKNIGKMTIKPDGTITTEMVNTVPDAGFTTYTVQKNDSLSKIAVDIIRPV